MVSKQDKTTPRTAVDIERKYGQKINEAEKAVESQKRDLTALNIKLKKLAENINEVNKQIDEINTNYKKIIVNIDTLNKSSHIHENKSVLDLIKEEDIDKWNNNFNGSYNVVANNIEVNQTIEEIDNYNLILVGLTNIERYIPCYKYQNSYKGIVVVAENEQLIMNEIEITVQEKVITNIKSNYSICEIIGIF